VAPAHSRLLEIGRIGRPHGLRGDVTVSLMSNRPERLSPGSRLHTDLGPLTVASARPHASRYVVAFHGVGSREQAEPLRGLVLRAAPLDDPDELWAHELIGAEAFDQAGARRGEVVAVLANPASDLLELDSGALVPARFVTALTPRVRVDVDVPVGLFERAAD